MDAAMWDNLTGIALVLLLIGLIASTWRGGRDEELRRVARRQADIDRKLDLVLAHLGVAVPEERHDDVERLLAEGKFIHAVKAYRDRTGAGLRDAKEAVEAIARRRGLPLQ
ncbi:hypothetical protein [Spirilliplanes yamanashiensis]